MAWPGSRGGHSAPPRSRRTAAAGAGCAGRRPGDRGGPRRDAGSGQSSTTTPPPLPASPGTPEQTLQRFILAKKQSAASKLLLRAGQEKWVFNRQGRRAWQPATAAGEINKQRSCNFRSEQKLRSRRDEPAARPAGRASSPVRSGRGEHLRPPDPSPRPPRPRDSSGAGASNPLRCQEQCRRAGSGRRADGHPCLSRSGAAARLTAAVRHGRPRGGRKGEVEAAGEEPSDREAARRRLPEGLQACPGVPAASTAGARPCRPRWPHRGGAALPLSARSGLGAEHSRLPRISLPAASRRRLAHSRLCRRQGRAIPQLLQWH
ncbi:uncharacterized protein LOC121333540 [Onychostruthus taczanowskii]|uniref:uncharacterized protein LOC121333540 n=1 Tax=Onychostruthus taczanowskii TaxID=356909 RepID=UPI001B806CAF|nr:uncharacterized protein LOC121333540 [Onychostruthus taczanowskii]